MNSRTRSRRPASIGSNPSSRRWIAVSACDCSAAEFVLLLVMAWSPPALKRRDCLGFRTRRLRHLQFQPHPGRHPRDDVVATDTQSGQLMGVEFEIEFLVLGSD